MQTQVNFLATSIQENELRFDAKSFLKVFKSGNNYISSFPNYFPSIQAKPIARQPLWVSLDELQVIAAKVANAEKTIEFEFSTLLDQAFDWAYALGLTQYKSAKRIQEEKAAELQELNAQLDELKQLRVFKAQVEEKTKLGVNPAIQFLNDVWFPVLTSGVFALVIGSFSFEILNETMGMSVVMNVLLAAVYVLFPILTSIRQYQFDWFGYKVSPLAVVMIADMVFTAYHVGWLRTTPTHGPEMHTALKVVYIVIIPLFQKATNDMILKVRASYLSKGWLTKI